MPHCIALKIGSLNIHGQGKVKLECDDIREKIKNHHIFAIQESWLGASEKCPDVKGYSLFRSERKKHIRARRHCGGSVIYIQRSILSGVLKLSNRSNKHGDVIWIKLLKDYFGLESDLFLCSAYITPEAEEEAFEILSQEIGTYSTQGIVNILGDLNSRIGRRKPEHFEVDIENGHSTMTTLPVPNRKSQDTYVNGNGRKLLKLMSDHNLLIANGSICGDWAGEFSCLAWNGQSVNDFYLFHRDFLRRVNYFKVNGPFEWYSDHKYITLSLRVNFSQSNGKQHSNWIKTFRKKMIWNTDNINKFKEIISRDDNKSKLDNFTNGNYDSADDAANIFTSIITSILEETFTSSRRPNRNHKPRTRREGFSYECQLAKRNFKRAQRNLSKNNDDVNRRHTFIKERRKYRKAIYFNKKVQKEQRINRLVGLEKVDTKTFWKELKSLLSPKDDALEMINKDDWSRHFHDLLNVPPSQNSDGQFLDYIKSSIPHLENAAQNDDVALNKDVCRDELWQCVKDLKLNKSMYLDNIGNEAFKYGFDYICGPLMTLYNNVFFHGTFPKL